MNRAKIISLLGISLMVGAAPVVRGADGQPADPLGVLRKPIPDKLVVLTFDDGPLSGYSVVAPILKSYGFNGSFYVCDFDSFKTRKDWYMTWRQMKAMADAGFEIGNHSAGHSSGMDAMLTMENELLAHHVPKPTTIAWPLHQANVTPELAANGYIFARGGHNRPYRPTVDNPFEIPSMWCYNMEDFVKMVRQAAGGRIVAICYHGVPDMEHPGVSLDPGDFKIQMQYLKDNHYRAIALRDLVEYIDPLKAAKLPPTANEFKDPGPVVLADEIKPYVNPGNAIQHFGFPNQPGGQISNTTIRVTAPHALDITAIAPVVRLPDGATITPGPDVVRDFSKPQTYTLTCKDGTTKTYTVTVTKAAASPAKDILTFELQGPASVIMAGPAISVVVPAATDVTKLAPAFTLPPFAKAVPASGSVRDFSRPQTYTVTAEDGTSRDYTVTVVKASQPTVFTWSSAAAGKWSDAGKWSNNLTTGTGPAAAGQPDYVLNFNQRGTCAITHDLNPGFVLNQLILGDGCGGMTLGGNSLTFARNGSNKLPPVIRAGKCQRVDINVPVVLQDDLSVNTFPDKDPACFISFNEVISGPRALILNSSGDPNVPGINFHDMHFGILQINNSNTYSGGTLINGGKINVRKTDGLGTGPVKLDNFGTLSTDGKLANPVVINSGTLFHCALSGPVTLGSIANFISDCEISGPMSGPGGLVMLGTNGTYLSMVPGGTLTLSGSNTYTGPTTVFPGTLIVKKAAGLYNGDPLKWTPSTITVHKAATLRLNVGGPEEFTGTQISALLTNLTKNVNGNGLLAGSVLYLDTANAKDPVVLAGTIADSNGPAGGAFVFKIGGGGTLQLSGRNTYTGQTIMQGGTLIVNSLNSVGNGKAGSSLGVPSSLENGIIEFDGDCTLTYTGSGEVSDRIINLTGQKQSLTINQAGGGLLKLTSPFDISGFGHSKTLVLTGTGAGELAGTIANPHDRKNTATLALTKSGTGTWTLSGANSYTGPTLVTGGTLSLTSSRCLNPKTEISVAEGAKLGLDFKGEIQVGKLTLGGKVLSAGKYDRTNAAAFIKGTGVVVSQQ